MELSPKDKEQIREGLKLLEQELEKQLKILRNPERNLIGKTEAKLRRVHEVLEYLETGEEVR